MTDKNVLTLKGTNERIDAIEKQIEEEKGWVEFSTPLSPEWLVTEFNEEKGGITIKGEEDITLLPGDEILDAPHRTRLKVEADGLAVIIKGNDILYKGYRYY
mgnify:CR=1 FL=1